MKKIARFVKNFFQKIIWWKRFVISAILIGLAILGLAIPSLSFIITIYVFIIGVFFFFLIFYWLVCSTYDFERKKLKIAHPLQTLFLIILLLLMSIPGGSGGVFCLLSLMIFVVLQVFLWLRFLVKKFWLKRK